MIELIEKYADILFMAILLPIIFLIFVNYIPEAASGSMQKAPPSTLRGTLTTSTSEASLGEKVILTGKGNTGYTGYLYTFYITKGSDVTMLQDVGPKSNCEWIPSVAGTYTLSVDIKDTTGASVTRSKSCVVLATTMRITSFTTSPADSIEADATATLSATATGGTGAYKYRFYTILDGVDTTLRNYAAAATYNWIPNVPGTYNIGVQVSDATGAVVKKEITFTVRNKWNYDALTTVIPSPAKVNDVITIIPQISNGTDTLQYKYVCTLDSTSTILKDFSSDFALDWIPDKVGSYTIQVTVKDTFGRNETKNIPYQITLREWNYVALVTDKASPQKPMTPIIITPTITGDATGLSYKYSVITSNSTISILKDFSSDTSFTWVPPELGDYILKVEVKDTAGKMESMTHDYNIQ